MSIDNNLSKQKEAQEQIKLVNLENQIKKLETKIITEYKLGTEELSHLIQFIAEKSREELKKELQNSLKIKEPTNFEKLAGDLIELRDLKKSLRIQIDQIKTELKENKETSLENISRNELIVKKLFNKDLILRANNPKNFTDHLIGAGIGLTESLVLVGKFSVDVLVGVVKTPYHLYKLLTDKNTSYDNIKNI